MTTIRTVKFGYGYKNAVIVVNETEAKTVRHIFELYLSGSSLGRIAKKLTDEKVIYHNNSCNWNKIKISRILDDDAYAGNEYYKPIITTDIYRRALAKKKAKGNSFDKDADVYQISPFIRCAVCGEKMRRYFDKRINPSTIWYCKRKGCKGLAAINDNQLIDEVIKMLNWLIESKGSLIQHETPKTLQFRSLKVENELISALNNPDISKDKVISLIKESASIKYSQLDNQEYYNDKLREYFQKEIHLSEFSIDLFRKAVKQINLQNNTVSLTLKNNQVIGGKHEQQSARKESSCDTRDKGSDQSENRKQVQTA